MTSLVPLMISFDTSVYINKEAREQVLGFSKISPSKLYRQITSDKLLKQS